MSTLAEPWMDDLEGRLAVAAGRVTTSRRAPRRARRAAAAALFAVLFVCGAALAESYNPLVAFQNLLGAQRAQTPGDMTPSVRAMLEQADPKGALRLEIDQTRLLQVVPDAASIYDVPTGDGNLCLFSSGGGMACGPKLGSSVPIRWMASSVSGQDTLVTGLARDDVRSVSITIGGETKTVAVRDNTFWLREASGWKVPSAFVVTLADGTSVAYPTGVPKP